MSGFNIKIENFGPIKNADINIKPLTVLVGPNNSGKSYSAILIHALTHYLSEPQYSEIPDVFWYNLSVNALEKGIDTEDAALLEFTDLINTFLKENELSSNSSLAIPKDMIINLIKLGLSEFYNDKLEKKIEYLFFSKLNELVSVGADSFKFSKNDLKLSSIDNSLQVDEFPKFKFKKNKFSIFRQLTISEDNNTVLINFNYEHFNDDLKNDKKKIVAYILLDIYGQLAVPLLKEMFGHTSYYLPAARSGIMQSYKSFMANAVRMSSRGSGLSGIVSDLGASIGELNSDKKTEFFELTEDFENKLFNGQIVIDNQEKHGLPNIFFRSGNLQLPLHLTSSSITELAPLFLYVKHLVKKGDILIIEEPEAHLHPENQRKLVQFLVKLVKNGLNLIITTHSDYILEQIENFLLMGRDKKLVEKYGYDPGDYLDENQLGVYLFKKNKKFRNFSSEKLEIGKFGISETNFSPVIDALYDESHKIKRDLFG